MQRTYRAYNCNTYSSGAVSRLLFNSLHVLNLKTFALSCYSSARWCTLSVLMCTKLLLCSSGSQKNIQVEFWITIFIAPKWRFLQKKSKIASLMSCKRSDLRSTLKYSQSRDLEDIQWILWTYTDAVPCTVRDVRHSKTSHGFYIAVNSKSSLNQNRAKLYVWLEYRPNVKHAMSI